MIELHERRKSEKYNALFTFIRLAIELVAIVWAVAGLNNATNTLRDTVLDNKKDIFEIRKDLNIVINRIGIIEVKIQK